MRNWPIGYYIEEYERSGIDRQQYGEKLLDRLAESLTRNGVSGCARRELYRYRRFYLCYTRIVESLTPQLKNLLSEGQPNGRKREAPTPELGVAPDEVLSKLSFTHIVELLRFEDATQRAFYEVECIRGNWSVRELKRQIGSLYYERSGLSHDKEQRDIAAGAERKSASWALLAQESSTSPSASFPQWLNGVSHTCDVEHGSYWIFAIGGSLGHERCLF